MKMNPIVFSERYSNEDEGDNTYRGFTPFRTETESVIARRVEIEPTSWQGGAALRVRVVQEKFDLSGGGRQTEKLHERWIYDREQNEQMIVPSPEQTLLIQALESQELRGRYACSIVNSLYIDMVVLNPKFGLDRWLPEVVNWWKDHYKKYNFEVKSK